MGYMGMRPEEILETVRNTDLRETCGYVIYWKLIIIIVVVVVVVIVTIIIIIIIIIINIIIIIIIIIDIKHLLGAAY